MLCSTLYKNECKNYNSEPRNSGLCSLELLKKFETLPEIKKPGKVANTLLIEILADENPSIGLVNSELHRGYVYMNAYDNPANDDREIYIYFDNTYKVYRIVYGDYGAGVEIYGPNSTPIPYLIEVVPSSNGFVFNIADIDAAGFMGEFPEFFDPTFNSTDLKFVPVFLGVDGGYIYSSDFGRIEGTYTLSSNVISSDLNSLIPTEIQEYYPYSIAINSDTSSGLSGNTELFYNSNSIWKSDINVGELENSNIPYFFFYDFIFGKIPIYLVDESDYFNFISQNGYVFENPSGYTHSTVYGIEAYTGNVSKSAYAYYNAFGIVAGNNFIFE